jgi:hypothetical protein
MDFTTFAAGRTATPHLGAFIDSAPRTICNTGASGLAPLDEAPAGRMCKSCDRGAAVLRSDVLRPEVRLLATARGAKAMGHYLIDGSASAYCGVQLGEGIPSSDRVCKVCESLRVTVAAFDVAWASERCGYDVEADAPYECNGCEWVGRYAEGTEQAQQEWTAHEDACAAYGEDEVDEQPLAAEDIVGTWREEWITEGQQALEGLLDEQGALFA